jgi:hypothetical protein
VPRAARRAAAAGFVLPQAAGGCGGDAEEALVSLPARLAEKLRAGELDDAWDFLAHDFSAHGLNAQQLRVLLPREIDLARTRPWVIEVRAEPAADGARERDLLVLAALVPGDAADVTPSRCRVIRIRAHARREGRDWLLTEARYEP